MNKKQSFIDNGYLFVPGLVIDPENLYENAPTMRGQLTYYNNRIDKVSYSPIEQQVEGSLARYNIPTYRHLHFSVKKEIENILGMDLHPTYFYDRFYFPGQELTKHRDRPACEISVTLQISTTLKEPWPIWFQTHDGIDVPIYMKNGDAAIYRGCELVHWRDPMPTRYNKFQKMYRNLLRKENDDWHHQIFLHYVDANGPFVHHAFDSCNYS